MRQSMFQYAAQHGYKQFDKNLLEQNSKSGKNSKVTLHDDQAFFDCLQSPEDASLLQSEEQRAVSEFKKGVERDLGHYILMHCAKVELTLIDLGTGEVILKDEAPQDLP